MLTLEVNTEYATLPQRKPNAANPAFNARQSSVQCRQSCVLCRQSCVQCRQSCVLCRQFCVQCTPQRGKSSQPGASEHSERHPGFRANPSDTPQRGKSSDRSVQIQRTKTFVMLPRTPAPRPTPIINLARTRAYIRKTNPSKMFQPFSHHPKPAENQRKIG